MRSVNINISEKQGIFFLSVTYPLAGKTLLMLHRIDTKQKEMAEIILKEKKTLFEALGDFLYKKSLAGLEAKSIRNYESFISMFILNTETSSVENMNYDIVEKYIVAMYERNVSKGTINSYLTHVRAFIRWLEKEKKIKKEFSSKIAIPKMPKKNIHIYSEEEVKQIFMAINDEASCSIEWIRARNLTIVALMLDSGLRREEVTKVKRSDFKDSGKLLNVHGKGNKDRIVPVGELAKALLNQYLQLLPHEISKDFQDEIFFTKRGDQLNNNTMKQFLNKLEKMLPFELSSHKLRHNFATNYCLNQQKEYGQIDIYKLMVLMGHEDINTTRRYLHVANQILASRNAISHLDQAFYQNSNQSCIGYPKELLRYSV